MRISPCPFLALFAALAPWAEAENVIIFTGAAAPETVATHITVGDLSVLPGPGGELTNFTTGTNASGSYSASTWTTSETETVNSAFTFTITPQAGYNLNLTGLSFDYKIQGNGPDKVALAYDAVVFGTFLSPVLGVNGEDDVTYNARNAANSYNNASLNVTLYGGTTYSMYIMGYSSSQPNRSANIDNLTLVGTVTAVPEPTMTAMLFGAAALTGVMIRRRRARG